MAPGVLVLAVFGIFALVVIQARYRVVDRRAKPYVAPRLRVTAELRQISPAQRRITWAIRGYRWKARRPTDQIDWLGQLDVTESAVFLRPRLVLFILLGVPLFLPCYRIPLTDILQVSVQEDDRPLAVFRLLGSTTSRRLAIRTNAGATCFVEFAPTSDVHKIREIISG